MTTHELKLFIIGNFVIKSFINYPRDMKLAARLVAKFSDPKFWEGMKKPFPYLQTMAQLSTTKCLNFLEKQYNIHKANQPVVPYEIDENLKYGKDKQYDAKPKSLIEFMSER